MVYPALHSTWTNSSFPKFHADFPPSPQDFKLKMSVWNMRPSSYKVYHGFLPQLGHTGLACGETNTSKVILLFRRCVKGLVLCVF